MLVEVEDATKSLRGRHTGSWVRHSLAIRPAYAVDPASGIKSFRVNKLSLAEGVATSHPHGAILSSGAYLVRQMELPVDIKRQEIRIVDLLYSVDFRLPFTPWTLSFLPNGPGERGFWIVRWSDRCTVVGLGHLLLYIERRGRTPLLRYWG